MHPDLRVARSNAIEDPDALALVPFTSGTTVLSIPSSELRGIVQKCQSTLRAHRFVAREQQHQDAVRYLDWKQASGADACMRVVHGLPSLGREVTNMVAVPTGRVFSWIRLALPADKLLPRLIAMDRSPALQALVENAQSVWRGQHRQQLHKSITPLPKDPTYKGKNWRYRPKPTCLEAKICLCGKVGDSVWDLNRRVAAWLRQLMKPMVLKDSLLAGDVVVNMTALTSLQEGECEGEGFNLDQVHESLLAEKGFVHISMMYEQPVRPTFRCIESLR